MLASSVKVAAGVPAIRRRSSDCGAAVNKRCSSLRSVTPEACAWVVTAPVMIPYFVFAIVMQQPNGAISTALSLFPMFTPMLMLLRMALPGVGAITVPQALFFTDRVGEAIDDAGMLNAELEAAPYGPQANLKTLVGSLVWYAEALKAARK